MIDLSSMFHGLGSIYEIDSSITLFEQLLSTSSRSDPRRLPSVLVLALLRYKRYELSNQSEDYDKSIFHFTESILLQPHSLKSGQIILPSLLLIANALVKHSEASKQPEGVIYAAKYLRYLRDHPCGVSGLPRQAVTASLVGALARQVELEARNVMQCIEEMAVLCHELLTLEASGDDTTRSITRFSSVISSKITQWAPDQPLDQVIECLRLAREHRPDVRVVRYSLAWSLICRYCTTFVNNDYEEAVSVLNEFIASSSAGDDELVTGIQDMVTALAMIRSMAHGTPEYWEEAIYRAQGPETSSGNSLLSRPVPAVWFGNAPELEPTFEKLKLLQELHSEICNPDITEIGQFYWFGLILFEAFERTNKIEYLNESISTHRQLYEHPSSHLLRSRISGDLSTSLHARVMFFPGLRTQDLDEIVKLFSQCANNALASLPTRFLHSYTLLFSPTLQQQHATLNAFRSTRTVSLDYASYQVDLHRLEEAVETLERGRALLWSEMRHLRASIDQLQQEHPQLGHEFEAINNDLEELTKSIPPSHKLSIDDDAANNSGAVDPFGRLLLKQRELLKERDNLTSRVRALPGFDSFLTSPSFDTLRSAASSGPVIIINHSKFRSDILILLHNTSPSLIPTSDDFYDRASALKNNLLDSRLKYGLDSSHYNGTLASVLAELYDLVGKPVIDRLDQLQVPRQSRIWWCPTSVFCSLPLHAMGPVPSDDGEKRYFLDLYICSYTPTLTALIQSRNRDSGSRSLGRPSLLLVAQPDPSLPTVGGEVQVVQSLDTEVTSLISEAATPAAVIDGFHRHRFVHFACHGTLETGKPFEAGFELYGERLTLLEIVRSHLPTAEFAFLSACHTAEVTEGSLVDEGLHLAAAVQYCGFRSVVGSTWAMVDEDGRDLAKHFYKALFSNSGLEQGVPYHERSAKALRFAVKKLRKKRRITLERWVNFVHYGA
ncbi:CHAT domain-containing protein [Lactarius sanguifluus]|nr:CHAT domain-containing protein [Lactarius sanguifluus]